MNRLAHMSGGRTRHARASTQRSLETWRALNVVSEAANIAPTTLVRAVTAGDCISGGLLASPTGLQAVGPVVGGLLLAAWLRMWAMTRRLLGLFVFLLLIRLGFYFGVFRVREAGGTVAVVGAWLRAA